MSSVGHDIDLERSTHEAAAPIAVPSARQHSATTPTDSTAGLQDDSAPKRGGLLALLLVAALASLGVIAYTIVSAPKDSRSAAPIVTTLVPEPDAAASADAASTDGGESPGAADVAPIADRDPLDTATTDNDASPVASDAESTATTSPVTQAPAGDGVVDTSEIAEPTDETDGSEPAPDGATGIDETVAPSTDRDESTAPDAVEEPTTEPSDDAVEESRGVIRNGQIFLEGAVPTVESGAEIEALAVQILGPDNVFNNYVVDPRASDPTIGNLTVEDTINFATNSSVLLAESEELLNQGFALMTIRPNMTLLIVGHTDSRGSDEQNQQLSEQRAESVKQWFVDRGIAAERIATEGAGEAEPVAANDTSDGQRQNRRIQFFIENLIG